MKLRTPSSNEWLEAVLGDFDSFLLDHAACERKASAMALTFVVRYPDRDPLLEPMITLAREELAHFHQVFKILRVRGLEFRKDERDPYVNALLRQTRRGREEELMDRLLLAGVVEARGNERFQRIADALEEPEMKGFYGEIARSEARHADLFVELASALFPKEEVEPRLEFWLDREAEAIAQVPPRPALH